MVSWIEALRIKRYPHFKPIETEIAKMFIRKYKIPGDYIFDFRLPVEEIPRWRSYPEYIQRAIRSLKARRIDIVIRDKEMTYLVEVKDRLNAQCIGQLLVYREIYSKKVEYGKPIGLIATYRVSDRDTEEIARSFGITLCPV